MNDALQRFLGVSRTSAQLRGDLAMLFGRLCEDNFVVRHTPELPHERKLVEQPDAPFGGIELPGLYPIAIVVLKLVMEVVITFTESEPGHERAVSG